MTLVGCLGAAGAAPDVGLLSAFPERYSVNAAMDVAYRYSAT
ncbi:MAG: hypothetical protein ACO3J3_11550 [Candidatus Nanopelagicales bacterium]